MKATRNRCTRMLNAIAVAVRLAVCWVLFRLLQFVVGAPFTLLICIQIGVAWVLRQFAQPKSLQKIKAARREQQKHPAAAVGQDADGVLQQTGATQFEHTAGPRHLFPEPEKGHGSLAWQLIGPYMRQYGRHAIANSQLFNPEYVHFFVPGVGSLPYVVADIWNRVVIIGTGEPLAPRTAWRQLTEAFLQEFPKAYFYHITEEFADLLHDMGYWINGCGTETTLQVKSWTYTSKTRVLRAAARAARESGVRVRELAPEELTDELRAKLLHDVTGCWRQQKAIADRELRVFVRHVDFDNMELQDGVRLFVAEAYEPAMAPPASVDPLLQGAALNAKPPKPPRRSRSQGKGLTPAGSSQPLSMSSSTSNLSSCSFSQQAVLNSSSSGEESSGSLFRTSGSAGSCITPEASADRHGFPIHKLCGSDSSSSDDSGSDCLTKVDVLPHGPAADAAAGKKGGKVRRAGSAGFCQQESTGVREGDTAAVRDQDAVGQAALAPELVGFVLLDPLWEGGQEVGYVASVMRMKRSAHAGTLKLLTEDIISCLRKEGKKEFTFGFAPLYNNNDSSGRRYLHWIRWVSLYLFHCANNVYAFKNLAYSKVRYGGGLNKDGTAFNDPNVTLSYVYLAAKHYTPGWSILDLYGFFAFVGIIDNPISVFLKLLGLKKGGENLE